MPENESPPSQEVVATQGAPRRSFIDLLRPSRRQLAVALALFLVAFATVTQMRNTQEDDAYSTLRRTDLVQMLDTLDSQSTRLESEVRDLETTRDQLRSGADAQKFAAEQARKRIEVLGILAGTIPAHGKGVRITILDPQEKYTPVLLLDALEELRDAGAEVIEINDKIRMVGSSWVAAGEGNEIVADGQIVTRPIVLDVIGEPHSLEQGARFRGGLVSEAESPTVGGSVLITRPSSVTVTSTTTPVEFVHARPA